MKLCECGCGKLCNRKFIRGHNTKVNNPMKKPETRKKCSEIKMGRTKETHEYLKMVAEKNKQYMLNGGAVYAQSFTSKESYRIAAEKRTGRTKENNEGRRKAAEKMTGRTKETHEGVRKATEKLLGRTKETYEYLRERAEIQRNRTKENDEGRKRQANWMKTGGASYIASFVTKEGRERMAEKNKQLCLNGHAAYMNKFIKNPSGPELETRKIVKELYPESEHTYPILSYAVDNAILELKIVIEYDGSYWHQDKEKDLKRQKEIEKEGWRFLRYIDHIPTLEQVKEDIRKIIDASSTRC